MATIIGTGYSETLTGGISEDTIEGRGGSDYILGNAGNDTLYGGTGQDSLEGGAGDDTLIGGAGNDAYRGGEGTDSAIFTGNFSDYVITAEPFGSFTLPQVIDIRAGSPDGSDNFNTTIEKLVFADRTIQVADLRLSYQLQPGSPVFFGSPLGDDVTGSVGDDTFRIGSGDDIIDGGAGMDRIILWGTPDYGFELDFTGGAGSVEASYGLLTFKNLEALTWTALIENSSGTRVTGWNGDDVISGYDGRPASDYFDGAGGQDLLEGHGGDDELHGGAGDDTLNGGEGMDLLNGGDGQDIVNGGRGADQLYGGDGDDIIHGGPDRGDDVIVGGKGKDTITTGFGYDTIKILPGDSRAGGGARDVVTDFQKGTDKVDFTAFGHIDYATQVSQVKVGSGLIVYLDVNQNGFDYSDGLVTVLCRSPISLCHLGFERERADAAQI